jgi:hypothetical protein
VFFDSKDVNARVASAIVAHKLEVAAKAAGRDQLMEALVVWRAEQQHQQRQPCGTIACTPDLGFHQRPVKWPNLQMFDVTPPHGALVGKALDVLSPADLKEARKLWQEEHVLLKHGSLQPFGAAGDSHQCECRKWGLCLCGKKGLKRILSAFTRTMRVIFKKGSPHRSLLSAGAAIVAFSSPFSERPFYIYLGFGNLTTWNCSLLRLVEDERHFDWVQLMIAPGPLKDSCCRLIDFLAGLDLRAAWTVEILQLDVSLRPLDEFDLSTIEAARLHPPLIRSLQGAPNKSQRIRRAAPVAPAVIADAPGSGGESHSSGEGSHSSTDHDDPPVAAAAAEPESDSSSDGDWWFQGIGRVFDDVGVAGVVDPPVEFEGHGAGEVFQCNAPHSHNNLCPWLLPSLL